MVLSVECALIKLSLSTRSVVVTLDVRAIRVDQSTENAADLVGLRIESTGTLGATNPSFQRKMQRLLMSLPVVFCTEGFLVSVSESSWDCWIQSPRIESIWDDEIWSENGESQMA